MQNISTIVWGEGEPVVLVHGSGDTDPAFVWSNQRPLAQHYQLLILTRPGYGQQPLVLPRLTIEEDVQEILSILEEKNGVHLVGFSYGGCIALVAAARQPELVRSLTVIEPPAFSIARGNAAVEDKIEQTKRAYESPQPLSPEEFLVLFMKPMIPDFPDVIELSPKDRKGVEAMQAEPAPWKIEIPLDVLATTSFPKLVVTSGESPAFEAVADVLKTRLHAQHIICSGKGHYIPDTGEQFNQILETFLRSVSSHH
jgi:pimeloyl-ACP methyl ester carboxylesterase